MEFLRRKLEKGWNEEWGFTLPEVLITIVVLSILLSIATSTWLGTVESRRVDSAANQLAADLRQAHSSATNRLAPQVVSLTTGSSEYSMTGSASPRDLDEESNDDLVSVDTTVTITFKPDGRAEPTGAPITFKVCSADGNPFHVVEVIPETSRVQIDP